MRSRAPADPVQRIQKLLAAAGVASRREIERMIEAGVFESDEAGRVELVRGRITKMTPINYEHANAVQALTDWSYDTAPRDQVTIRVQAPLLLPTSNSVPQPDVFWITRKDYGRHPLPEDVHLLVEVHPVFEPATAAPGRGNAEDRPLGTLLLGPHALDFLRRPLCQRYRHRLDSLGS